MLRSFEPHMFTIILSGGCTICTLGVVLGDTVVHPVDDDDDDALMSNAERASKTVISLHALASFSPLLLLLLLLLCA